LIGEETPNSSPFGRNPECALCLKADEKEYLKRSLIDCEKKEADLTSTQKAYWDCLNTPREADSWWQNPVVVVGGMGITFAAGVLLTLVFK